MHSDANTWFAERGWKGNPFTLDIHPSLFIGHAKQVESLLASIEESQKYIVITGPTGAGKTTLLKYITSKYPSVYVAKPPTTKEDVVEVLVSGIIEPSFLDRLLRRGNATVYNIADKLNKKLGGKKMLLLVDESHETNIEMLAWLRSIVEQVKGLTVIFAALPTLKENHLRELKTLSERVTADIEIAPLERDEVMELIRKRISSVGGASIEPFTTDCINEIYKTSGGYPREVLKMCSSLVHAAIEKNASFIDAAYPADKPREQLQTQKNASCAADINTMTDKQLEIVESIAQEKCVTPSQIAAKISASYKSGSHALRAVNNILRRLERDGIVLRERKGRTYRYFVSPQHRSRFVKA